MAIYTNLPIYKSAYSLLLEVSIMMPRLSRDCRYTLGQELRHKIMEIILLVYRANRAQCKIPHIERMSETLIEAQVCIRLMCDLKYISEGRYVELIEYTSSISKQLLAWEKSERRKNSDDNVTVIQQA